MVKPMKNGKQYEAALEKVYALMQTGLKQDPEATDEPEILSVLVKHHENNHPPMESQILLTPFDSGWSNLI